MRDLMEFLNTIDELNALYGVVSEGAKRKGADHLTLLYTKWIEASRFCVLATVGPKGIDASPRGDDGPVVAIADPKTLLMPDWRGNNRLDSLRNIVRDGRVSLMFMIPKIRDVVRVNGHAKLRTDKDLCAKFQRQTHLPKTVIHITVEEVYIHCPKSVIRSHLWEGDKPKDIPSIGDILREVTDNELGTGNFDQEAAERVQKTLWS